MNQIVETIDVLEISNIKAPEDERRIIIDGDLVISGQISSHNGLLLPNKEYYTYSLEIEDSDGEYNEIIIETEDFMIKSNNHHYIMSVYCDDYKKCNIIEYILNDKLDIISHKRNTKKRVKLYYTQGKLLVKIPQVEKNVYIEIKC